MTAGKVVVQRGVEATNASEVEVEVSPRSVTSLTTVYIQPRSALLNQSIELIPSLNVTLQVKDSFGPSLSLFKSVIAQGRTVKVNFYSKLLLPLSVLTANNFSSENVFI